ncbi:MAG TPA: redoxin domain-containing protein [Candidatus Limnocylindrales bacterium]|jgi:cytochrome c biogenesis protein CcmG, thiol:disulfide interchange protein DsbE|nr:redoxin domain-containing protein [Candidatus Limnocylindrales bacterium]
MSLRSLRWLLVPLLVVPLTWLLFTGFGRDPRVIESPLIGRPAPAWTTETLDGGQLSSAELTGRPYVVNFWASWCVPACVDEHPVLAAAHAEHGDRLTLVGVLFDDRPDDARRFLDRYGDAGYRHVLDERGRISIDFGVVGPPETFFVDAEGIVRAKMTGPLTDDVMARHLGTILPGVSR